MTTNKPEVRVFRPSAQAGCPAMRIVFPSDRVSQDNKYVRLSDYEALQAECEKLRKVADQYRRLIELGDDFQWENIIRVDISDFPSRADAIDAAMQGDKP